MKQPLSLTWELESIFPGGSSSPKFEEFLKQLEADIETLRQQVAASVSRLIPNPPNSWML